MSTSSLKFIQCQNHVDFAIFKNPDQSDLTSTFNSLLNQRRTSLAIFVLKLTIHSDNFNSVVSKKGETKSKE